MSNWSWTRLKSLESCELQHDLHYNQKVKGKTKQDLYLVGRVVHKVIQKWAGSGYDDARVEEFVKSCLGNELKNLNNIDRAQAMEMLQRAALAAYAAVGEYRKLKLPEHEAIIEENFSMGMTGGGRLTGAPDAYDPVDHVIVDLKTQKTGKGDPGQLYTYAWYEQSRGREVVGGYFVYPTQRVKSQYVEISQENIDGIAQTFREATGNNGKTAKQGQHCYFCEYEGTKHCVLTYRKQSPVFFRFDQPASARDAAAEADGVNLEESSAAGQDQNGG